MAMIMIIIQKLKLVRWTALSSPQNIKDVALPDVVSSNLGSHLYGPLSMW